MNLKEFRELRKNIEQTHPVPKHYSLQQKTRFHAKVCFEWLDEFEKMHEQATSEKEKQQIEKDYNIAMDEIQETIKKAGL